ncbi:hypothetical protein RIR_jg3913.t2 [Rhizophagus irregularis DAOM 181602=DAOM 197198]|nr:hypothetical protein RIR_jg3913.t2 [Rhizophagus irregularis DAOM 181602=DAOM 197198]
MLSIIGTFRFFGFERNSKIRFFLIILKNLRINNTSHEGFRTRIFILLKKMYKLLVPFHGRKKAPQNRPVGYKHHRYHLRKSQL